LNELGDSTLNELGDSTLNKLGDSTLNELGDVSQHTSDVTIIYVIRPFITYTLYFTLWFVTGNLYVHVSQYIVFHTYSCMTIEIR